MPPSPHHFTAPPLTAPPLPTPLPAGCEAYTVFMPTGDPQVPQWCITFKQGLSNGRGGCYGRVAPWEIIATVRWGVCGGCVGV